MKKIRLQKLFLSLTLALISTFSFAQGEYTQLRNSGIEEGFDTFTAKVGLIPKTETFVEPYYWNSFGSGEGSLKTTGASPRMYKSTLVRPGSEGQNSVVIFSTAVIGIVANGNMTTGRINMVSTKAADNYNATRRSDPAFCHPFSALPDSFTVWVKYVPVNSAHYARVAAVIHDDYDLLSPSTNAANNSHIVGMAELNYPTVAGKGWQKLSFPFAYDAYASRDPRYILTTFTTSMTPGGGSEKDSVYIDDIALVYDKVLKVNTLPIHIYNLQTEPGRMVQIPYTIKGAFYSDNVVTAQLSDANGSFDDPVVLGTDTTGFVSGLNNRTIEGVIPEGMSVGTGYRIRLVASHYAIVGEDNGENITLKVSSTSFQEQPIQNNVKVLAGYRSVKIEGSARVNVYAISGVKVADVMIEGNGEVPVPSAGVYIVKAISGGAVKTVRVAVK